MQHIETDQDSGARIYRLVDDPRPADNIYGEQPYASRDGGRVVVRYYDSEDCDGAMALFDLSDGSQHVVQNQQPRFPAFHAWSDYLYYQQPDGGATSDLVLRRCHMRTLEHEPMLTLPAELGGYSYGTVSPDHRFYAASVHGDDGVSKVVLFDIASGERRTLIEDAGLHFKHEQFSLDGRNRVLIQANQKPDVKQVFLGVLEAEREHTSWLAADQPHTPRPTGHEAWIGAGESVLFSTGRADGHEGNLWIACVGEQRARLASDTPPRFGHVSVSRCGRYWIGDAIDEPDVPIHIGSVATGRHRPLVLSRTVHDGKQWSHTHPYLTADNRYLIYNSTRAGHPQVFAASVPDPVLADLD